MSSEVMDKFMLRLPDGMRYVIKEAAVRNRRSMNAEIVFHLERVFAGAEQVEVAAGASARSD